MSPLSMDCAIPSAGGRRYRDVERLLFVVKATVSLQARFYEPGTGFVLSRRKSSRRLITATER
jgi:hypothetical protein